MSGTWRAAAALAAMLASAPAAAQTCRASDLYLLDWDQASWTDGALSGTVPLRQADGATLPTTRDPLAATVTVSGTTSALQPRPAPSGRQTPSVGAYFTPNRTLTITTDFADFATSVGDTSNMVTIAIALPRRMLRFTGRVTDVDYSAGQFRDWLRVRGFSNGVAVTPGLTTPFGGANSTATTNAVQPGAGSSVVLNAGSLNRHSFGAAEVYGDALADANTTRGNLDISFASAIDRIEIAYRNGPKATMANGATAGLQSIAIDDLRFCADARLAVTKTSRVLSDPSNGAANPLNVPGALLEYALTVQNRGGSDADAGTTVLTDLLPPRVIFVTGSVALDPLPGGATWVALPTANVRTTNNGGATWTYTPTGAEDAAVNGVRMTPTGAVPPGSSFTIRFRARVN